MNENLGIAWVIITFTGMFAMIPKHYFHFHYMKIVRKYDVGFFKFLRSINKYFWTKHVIILPLFWELNEEGLTKEELQKLKQIKTIIYICLSISWFSIIFTLLIGVVYSEWWQSHTR